MTIYVDSSSLLKLYFDEPDSDACEALLLSDPSWVTARLTNVEVRRNLTRQLKGRTLAQAREQFQRDWLTMTIVELSDELCESAANLAEIHTVRTLDALHLAAARLAGGGVLPFVTYDLRQAQAARELGWSVLGV